MGICDVRTDARSEGRDCLQAMPSKKEENRRLIFNIKNVIQRLRSNRRNLPYINRLINGRLPRRKSGHRLAPRNDKNNFVIFVLLSGELRHTAEPPSRNPGCRLFFCFNVCQKCFIYPKLTTDETIFTTSAYP